MQIDRRITNGLAWAGAVFVVAIPVADFAAKQMSAPAAPSAVVVREEAAVAPALPTPASERPAMPAVAVTQPAVSAPAPAAQPGAAPEAQVANAAPSVKASPSPSERIDGQDAFAAYLRSGRDVPSYISGGSPAPAAPSSAPAAPSVAATNPAAPMTSPVAKPAPSDVAAAPAPKAVTLPTPVSDRPPSTATVTRVPAQPPLVIDTVPPMVNDRPAIISADELDDWESGPLSEFLARRQGQGARTAAPDDYDPDGFFLDQGPNRQGQRRFPSAYDSGFYFPFEQ